MSADRIAQIARRLHLLLAWVFVGCLVVQVLLVGLDLFEVTGPDAHVHRNFAYTYGWLAPAMVLLAVVGRLPRLRLGQTVALLVLFALQTYLPSVADAAPWLAALHAVNALVVVWLATHIALAAGGELRNPVDRAREIP
jgi:hypothetical protein